MHRRMIQNALLLAFILAPVAGIVSQPIDSKMEPSNSRDPGFQHISEEFRTRIGEVDALCTDQAGLKIAVLSESFFLLDVATDSLAYRMLFRAGDSIRFGRKYPHGRSPGPNPGKSQLFAELCHDGIQRFNIVRTNGNGVELEIGISHTSAEDTVSADRSARQITIRARVDTRPTDPDNPINPQTERPFTNRQMRQFEKLRKKFPGNSVIPQKLTREQKAERERQKQQIYELETKILKKEATRQEINEYYDYQIKGMIDRIELVDYVLRKPGDEISPEMREKLEKVRAMNERTLKSYEEARQRALEHAVD